MKREEEWGAEGEEENEGGETCGVNRRDLCSSGQVYLNIVLTACQNDRPSRC